MNLIISNRKKKTTIKIKFFYWIYVFELIFRDEEQREATLLPCIHIH